MGVPRIREIHDRTNIALDGIMAGVLRDSDDLERSLALHIDRLPDCIETVKVRLRESPVDDGRRRDEPPHPDRSSPDQQGMGICMVLKNDSPMT
jgi:hypothetical protein